jgi:hypothetical protein
LAYFIALFRQWVLWIPLALGIIDAIAGMLGFEYRLPTVARWGLALFGLLWAGFEVYRTLKSENRSLNERIIKLKASKTDALNAVIQEIRRNRDYAEHNARVKGSTSSPGGLAFIPLDDHSCKKVLLGGDFAFDLCLMEAANEYLENLCHINVLIDRVKAATDRFQNAGGTANAIRRYCSGQMDSKQDGPAKGLPEPIDNLQRLIEQEIDSIGHS